MRNIIYTLTIGVALMLTGCTDQQAQEYTAKINDILQKYEKQIKGNIASEQRAYEKLAEVYETEKQRDVFESLGTERALRSGALSGALVEGPARVSSITAELEQYASEDFDRTEKIYAEEMNAEAAYLKVLDSLQAETKKASDLAKILADMAKPPGLVQRGKDLEAWGSAYQTESTKQACLQIQGASGVATANATDAKTTADALKATADDLKAKLPTNPTDQEQAAVDAAQPKAAQAKAKSDKAKTNADALTAQLAKHPNFKAASGKCQ